jgi:hypothetical protein
MVKREKRMCYIHYDAIIGSILKLCYVLDIIGPKFLARRTGSEMIYELNH